VRNSVSLLVDSHREPTRVITLVEDITGQKLPRRLARVKSVFAMPSLTQPPEWHSQTSADFLAANQAFCQITGYTEWELIARDFPSITPIRTTCREMWT
jgi:hypothetical protein